MPWGQLKKVFSLVQLQAGLSEIAERVKRGMRRRVIMHQLVGASFFIALLFCSGSLYLYLTTMTRPDMAALIVGFVFFGLGGGALMYFKRKKQQENHSVTDMIFRFIENEH